MTAFKLNAFIYVCNVD